MSFSGAISQGGNHVDKDVALSRPDPEPAGGGGAVVGMCDIASGLRAGSFFDERGASVFWRLDCG